MPHYKLMTVPKKMLALRMSCALMAALCAWSAVAHANEAVFRADLAAKVKAADKNYDSVVAGRDGWLFFVPELRSVSVGKFWGANAKKVSRAVRPENADPLPAILDFKAQLAKAGVKLLLVPVPETALSTTRTPSSRQARMFASAWP